MRVYSDLVGGDPTRALVFIAAAQAVTQHINPKLAPRVDDTFIRDDLRRPVSLFALARSLGLSVETVRRHVIALKKWGERHPRTQLSLSQFMRLKPGDVVSTGAPPGVGVGFNSPLCHKAGDATEGASTASGRNPVGAKAVMMGQGAECPQAGRWPMSDPAA